MDYKKHTVSLIFLLLIGSTTILQAQNDPDLTAEEKRYLWSNIEPFFTPPEEYKDSYTSAYSPLKFYDGDTVRTKEDWERRRKEILTRWNEMMGERSEERRVGKERRGGGGSEMGAEQAVVG